MSDPEIHIGHKKIGMDTRVTFTVKTLFYFFGILFTLLSTLFGWFYVKTIEREDKLKQSIELSLNDFKKDMKDEIIPMRQQVFELAKGQGEIKSDIKSVIDKQLNLNVRNSDYRSERDQSPQMSPHQ